MKSVMFILIIPCGKRAHKESDYLNSSRIIDKIVNSTYFYKLYQSFSGSLPRRVVVQPTHQNKQTNKLSFYKMGIVLQKQIKLQFSAHQTTKFNLSLPLAERLFLLYLISNLLYLSLMLLGSRKIFTYLIGIVQIFLM